MTGSSKRRKRRKRRKGDKEKRGRVVMMLTGIPPLPMKRLRKSAIFIRSAVKQPV
jgi:hypothetical protein